MRPENYYPAKYLDDLVNYSKISSTAFYDLCPLILGEQFKNNKHINYISIKDFFTCQYCLNLISQAIHSNIPKQYQNWQDNSEKFLNIQGCYAHSFGGGVSRPIDLVTFLRGYQVNIEQAQMLEYFGFFLDVVLKEALPGFPVNDLVRKLLLDQDCIEIHSYLHGMNSSTGQD